MLKNLPVFCVDKSGRNYVAGEVGNILPEPLEGFRPPKISRRKMNFDEIKVVIRAKNTFISARLELDSQRAFAVICDFGIKDAKDVVGEERVEIDVRFLQQITESEYLYKKLVELPEPGRSGPLMLNRESGTDLWRNGAAMAETANRLSL